MADLGVKLGVIMKVIIPKGLFQLAKGVVPGLGMLVLEDLRKVTDEVVRQQSVRPVPMFVGCDVNEADGAKVFTLFFGTEYGTLSTPDGRTRVADFIKLAVQQLIGAEFERAGRPKPVGLLKCIVVTHGVNYSMLGLD